MSSRSFSIRSRTIEPLESRRYLTGSAISFMNHVDIPAGATPMAIVAADFNGDGHIDLAEADFSQLNVRIFLGNGNGTFTQEATPLSLSEPPSSMIVGDFNGDGVPDLAVGTEPGGNGVGTGVTIFINKAHGSGTFNSGQLTTVLTSMPANEAITIAAGDFNDDGHLDIATANPSNNSISILFGTGSGTFSAPETLEVGVNPTAIAAADLNGDGQMDLAIADQRIDANTLQPFGVITLLAGDGKGNFTAGPDVTLNTQNTLSLVAADMNDDGIIDLVVGSADGNVAVFTGSSGGGYSNSATVSTPGPVGSLVIADFNFDGDNDIAATDGGNVVTPNNSHDDVTVATGSGAATFPAQQDLPTGSRPFSVVAADFNGDSKPDLATANANAGTISILINSTPGTVQTGTTTSIASSNLSSPASTDVQFTATITPVIETGTLPTGTVRLFDGATLLAAVDITAGSNTAVFDSTSLSVGAHHLFAVYLGSSTFTSSHSSVITQSITPVAGNGPDLSVSFLSTTLPSQFVPGETAVARFLLTNVGNTIASGRITNALYLSLDGTIDVTDVTLDVRGSLAGTFVNLPANRSIALTGVFTVPSDIALGNYVLIASVNTTASLLESDAANDTNNTATSTGGELSAVDDFGAVGGRSRVPLVLPDGDGTPVNYILLGPGTGSVVVGDHGVDLSVTGTTAASSLIILNRAPGGNGTIDLHDISVDGPLSSLTGSAVNVSSDVTITGGAHIVSLRSVAGGTITLGNDPTPALMLLGNVDNATLNAAGGIQVLSVANWTTGGLVSAAWIGTLLSKSGGFAASLSLNGAGSPAGFALRAAVIAGPIGDGVPGVTADTSTWNITGNAATVQFRGFASTGFSANISGKLTSLVDLADFNTATFAAGNFGSILIRGNVTDADILAGANVGGDARLGGNNDAFLPGSITSVTVVGSATSSLIAAGLDPVDDILLNGNDQLLPGGTIRSLNVTGNADATTRILAATLPARARIAGAIVPSSDPRLNLP
jgi:hypothetical protein